MVVYMTLDKKSFKLIKITEGLANSQDNLAREKNLLLRQFVDFNY